MTSASASADGGRAALPYRLAGDPFQPWCDENAWYPDPARENSLKLLLHLAPYSDLLLVTGASGSGKSLFIKKFLAEAGDAWRILCLPGGLALDDIALLEALDQELSVRTEGDADRAERLRRLRRSLFVLRRGALLPILVVDDAHLLPPPAFDFLVELTEPREDGEKPIAVLLAGEGEALAARIEGAGERLQARVAHVFQLQPLGEAGTDAYIRHRLGLAGMQASDAFTPAVIRFIHTASRGLPGRINEFARVVLEEKQRKSRKTGHDAVDAGAGSDAGILLRYGLAALVVALAGLAFIYRDELPSLVGDRATEISIESDAAAAGAAEGAAESPSGLLLDWEPVDNEDTFSGALDAPDPGAIAEDRGAPPDDGSMPGVEDPIALVDAELATTERQGEEAPVAAIAAPALPADSGTVASEPASVEEEPSGVAGPPAVDELPPVPRREDWLLTQAPDTWTVQLFASREERLLALIEEHGLGSGAAVFKAREGDPPLYALVWEIFPSRADASQAIEGDLARIPGIKPWVRSLGDIQAVIKAQGGGR